MNEQGRYITFGKVLMILGLFSFAAFFVACKRDSEKPITSVQFPSANPLPVFLNNKLVTDKAIYSPGQEVVFTLDNQNVPATAKIRYKHIGATVSETSLNGNTWKWTVPLTDLQGYLVEVYSIDAGVETIYATTAVDVLSDWTKFPRYGFLSKFGQIPEGEMNAIIDNLNSCHINGIQFYDWHNKHHKPLPMLGAAPATSWKDIINRDSYFPTIEKYIAIAHAHNMKAMFYNLVYGAWDSGEADGLNKEWYVYADNTHTNKDFHPLSAPFLSNIYLLDPSNTNWQQYLTSENKRIYQFLAFDGYHMDQLGDRGARYKYDGSYLNLAQTYNSFIAGQKKNAADKYHVMNAVNQYGQTEIADSPVNFLYTEVWPPFDTYHDISSIIMQNNTLSNGLKNTVLAAYMNYDLANNKRYFNTASVLLTNAVIFAFGGSHIELGEHMLCKEYFPNNNLAMRDDLKKKLTGYYDFLVAYENLLRDGGTFNAVSLQTVDDKIQLGAWPASKGKVAYFGKKFDSKQVVHLINFTNSVSQNWRDNSGVQPEPVAVQDIKLVLSAQSQLKKIWLASPDFAGSSPISINFNQSADKVSLILPLLQYWDMLVIEY